MRRLLLACLALFAIGCDAATATKQPTPLAWTPPPDWVTVSDGGSITLIVPPWLLASDDSGGIFANEAPPGPGMDIPFQLMGLGPRGGEQPAPGQDLGAWIDTRLHDVGSGVPTVTRIALPAGVGVRYERADRFGTPLAWHLVAFAVLTPRGVAYLQFDGPEAVWAAHAAIPDQIATTLRLP